MSLGKTLSRRTLTLATLVGLALLLALIWYFGLKSPIQRSPALPTPSAVILPKHEQLEPGLPARLKIPSINVDAAIEYVGLTPQGDMGVPADPTGVAWYKPGPRPGEIGSSVIDGHFGYKDSLPAVFDNLYKLHKGDKLSVQDVQGLTTTFVVRESRSYNPRADAWDVFFSTDKKAHLNLITCEGTWNAAQKSYSNRLVVFADKQ